MAVISCISLFFYKHEKPALRGRGLRARNKKPGAASRPSGWRSFGEYIFLEDSRYASQEESLIVAASRRDEDRSGVTLR